LEEAFLGHIAQQNVGEIVNDASKDPRAVQLPGTPNEPHEHIMGVPILLKDKHMGLLAVWRLGIGTDFKPRELEFLTRLAQQAAVAIENARLYTQTQEELRERERVEAQIQELNRSLERRVEERTLQLQVEKTKIEQFAQDVQCLRALTNFLQACLTVEEAGGIISDHMHSLFPLTNGSLFLASEDARELEALTHWGNTPGVDELDPVTCWGMRRGRFYHRRHGDPSPVCTHFLQPPTENLCLPLLAQGEALGMISLYVVQEANAYFTEEVQNLAIASADSIALALANLRLREKLHQQAIHDPLSGLFNRRFMEETLDREIHRARRAGHPLSIIMFEIDNFKIYNNTYGHDAGDYVIRKLSDTVRSILRCSDYPCRYGGDEFTVLLPETCLQDAAQKAEELRRSVQAMALSYNNHALGTVTISVGVAAFPQHGDTGEAVRIMADTASYQAKAAGRNCVVAAE
jgi:diguanylate cyclase (GGDEF)-like protein